MSHQLSQKEIGKRIVTIRKLKGLSQEELSKRVRISRPSLAQVELGKRGIDSLELQRFSVALGFSLDDFMSEDFNAIHEEEVPENKSMEKTGERISIPHLNINKFRNVVLYILEKCAGKPNVGETVIYKLLYFSDFNYYELYEEHLTGASYRKLPFGPVPYKVDSVFKQMMDKSFIQRVNTDHFGYPQTRYIPLIKADLTTLKASEKEVIDKVIEQLGDWSAAAISDYSHKDIPWKATKEGEEINYELAFYRETPYSVRNYGDEIEEP